MSGHTEGPWTATASGHIFAGQMMVCEIRGWGFLTGTGGLQLSEAEAMATQDANARLIAAAPDLLNALKDMSRGDCFCEMGVGNPMFNKHTQRCVDARAAIAKAEGAA